MDWDRHYAMLSGGKLGGNDAAIVVPDIDVEKAAKELLRGIPQQRPDLHRDQAHVCARGHLRAA